ncbi:MAG: hypothetical protein AB7P01_10920 [Bacteroidia bacterium]
MENQPEVLDSNLNELESDVEKQYLISLPKFIILSLVSFGTYPVWWSYKAWRFFQQKDKLDIMPAVRTIFSIFFLYELFTRILHYAHEKNNTKRYSPGGLFAGYIIGNICSRLPDPLWLISLISFVFFIPVFNALNFAKRNSTEFSVVEQDNFNQRQIILLVIGVIFWGLVILGLSVGEDGNF